MTNSNKDSYTPVEDLTRWVQPASTRLSRRGMMSGRERREAHYPHSSPIQFVEEESTVESDPDWIGLRMGLKEPSRIIVTPRKLAALIDSGQASPNDWIQFDLTHRTIALVEYTPDSCGQLHTAYTSSASRQNRSIASFPFPCSESDIKNGKVNTAGTLRVDVMPPRWCPGGPDGPSPQGCTPDEEPNPGHPSENCRTFSSAGAHLPDGRCRLGICDGYSSLQYPYSTIGKLNGYATGTLIGRSTVLCAAHSVGLSQGGGSGGVLAWWQNLLKNPNWSIPFIARLDATKNGAPKTPFGRASIKALWVPVGYFMPTVASIDSPFITSNTPFDMCVGVLDKPIGGLAGYIPATYTYNIQELAAQYYAMGYPNCDGPGQDGVIDSEQRPPACPAIESIGDPQYVPEEDKTYYDNGTLWGSRGRILKAYYPNPLGSKNYGLVKTNITGSFGQSGQSLIVEGHPAGAGGPVAVGVYSLLLYPGAEVDDDLNYAGSKYNFSYYSLITPPVADMIAIFVSIFDPDTIIL